MGALGGGPAPNAPEAKERNELTAVWLEFELQSPGRGPQKICREIMDVLGPAARTSGKSGLGDLDEPAKVARGLELLAGVEILPLVGDLSPAFVTRVGGQALLSQRDVLSVLAAPGRTPDEKDIANPSRR